MEDKNITTITELYRGTAKVKKFAGSDMYIAERENDKTVFRFSDKETAFNNFYTSRVLRKYKIPVPDIQVHRIDRKYCEVYQFINGETLYEKHKKGMTPQAILKVFDQLYDICRTMAEIPLSEMAHLDESVPESRIFGLFKRKMGIKPKKIVGHYDLNDKNILLDENNNICGILGIDSISLKPMAELFVKFFETSTKSGYDIEHINKVIQKSQHHSILQNIIAHIKPCKGL